MTENTPIPAAIGVRLAGVFLGVLGSKIYRKWRKKKQHEQEVFHQAHLDEIEAQKLHDKLVDSRVEMSTLDSLLINEKARISVIKIDVEGY